MNTTGTSAFAQAMQSPIGQFAEIILGWMAVIAVFYGIFHFFHHSRKGAALKGVMLLGACALAGGALMSIPTSGGNILAFGGKVFTAVVGSLPT